MKELENTNFMDFPFSRSKYNLVIGLVQNLSSGNKFIMQRIP